MLASAFGPAEPAGRVLVTDPAVRRLLRVRGPVETDGRMGLSHWFAADDGEVIKTDWAHAGERVASCDPACDLAQIAARDGAFGERVRAAWAALGREPVDAERWLLYRLAHLWSERDAALVARAARDYFHDVFFADLRPPAEGPLCALDVDGVLELDVLGFPALTPASAGALRALLVHGYRPVLVSGRGSKEIAERCAAYRLPAGVAEYGAVVHIAEGGRETSLLTDEEAATLERVRAELSSRDGVEIDAAYRHIVRARPPSTTAVAPGVRVLAGDSQADFVPARVDKGVGIRALAARLDAPLHAAIGDTAADAPMLALAERAFVPAHAPRELRSVATMTRRPYQAGFHEAVGALLGHAPGTCAECRVPDVDERRRLLLALLGLREGGLRGMPRRALRVALAR
jgi:hydroxymethylpyrimidine pyrophosphatase-like HAD family hydrolase